MILHNFKDKSGCKFMYISQNLNNNKKNKFMISERK